MSSLGPQFGRLFKPPTVNDTLKPPREWTGRPGFAKRHVGPDETAGQGYLFRARTSDEKFHDQAKEVMRVNREHAQREGYLRATHSATMHAEPLHAAAPAEHWPVPAQTAQHGEYTVAAFPGHAWGMAAFHGDRVVGRLQVNAHGEGFGRHPTVAMVETAGGHRRQGLARAMWHLGQQFHGGGLRHSLSRTPLGEKFARGVGGVDSMGKELR